MSKNIKLVNYSGLSKREQRVRDIFNELNFQKSKTFVIFPKHPYRVYVDMVILHKHPDKLLPRLKKLPKGSRIHCVTRNKYFLVVKKGKIITADIAPC